MLKRFDEHFSGDFELMAGASIAQYLLINNKKYGVGGFAPIIIVNMTESLIAILMKSSMDSLMLPLLISFVMVIIMIFMELHEKKIPLQRVSVHNVHAKRIIWPLNIIQSVLWL